MLCFAWYLEMCDMDVLVMAKNGSCSSVMKKKLGASTKAHILSFRFGPQASIVLLAIRLCIVAVVEQLCG